MVRLYYWFQHNMNFSHSQNFPCFLWSTVRIEKCAVREVTVDVALEERKTPPPPKRQRNRVREMTRWKKTEMKVAEKERNKLTYPQISSHRWCQKFFGSVCGTSAGCKDEVNSVKEIKESFIERSLHGPLNKRLLAGLKFRLGRRLGLQREKYSSNGSMNHQMQ